MNTCDICGGRLRAGTRVLWRVKENTDEELGFSATHLVCPRLLAGAVLAIVVLGLLALALVLALAG